MKTHEKTGWRATIALTAGLLIFWGCDTPPAPSLWSGDPQEAPSAPAAVTPVSEAIPPLQAPLEPSGGIESAYIGVAGEATFYCNSDPNRLVLSRCPVGYPDRAGASDMYAAAGPDLRVGNWRGRTVQVARGDRIIEVQLVDFCACGSAVIDLFADPMVKLGGSGRIDVTVSWSETAAPTPPSTDRGTP